MIQRLTGALDFQTQALVLRSERQRLIASNIANADTPGYAARDFDFARALREATGSRSGGAGTLGPAVAPRGLSRAAADTVPAAADTARHVPTLRWAAAAQPSADRNSVDMDRERASFADNTVKYEAALRFINGSVRTMLDAMRSPSQG